MEQRRTTGRTRGPVMTAARAVGVGMALSLVALATPVAAQFHAKTENGQTVATQPNPTAAPANPGDSPTIYRGAAQNAAFSDMGAVEGAKLGYSDFRNAVVWGRAIFHPDDTYTESKQDSETNSLTQETRSPNGVLLQRRLISLDAKGRPSEVLIYDGRGEYKYRGQILYDLQGNFQEEQIYDTNSQLLRRRIQEYDAQGVPERLKVVDDLSKIPPDLKLVITRDDGVARDAETAQRNLEEFQRNAKARRAEERGAETPVAAGEKKPGLLKRFFGKE